jgi:hypothetical protein
MLVSAILARVADTLLDPGHVRWPTTELRRYISDGARLIGAHKPDAVTTTDTWTLAAGAEQQLPDDAEALIDVLGATRIDPQVLDRFTPNWRTVGAARRIQHYGQDLRDPRRFTVVPPALAGATITAVYEAAITELGAEDLTVPIRDVYLPAMVDYVAFRAYVKDSDDTLNQQRATMHLQLVGQALGVQLQVAQARSPKANAAPREGMK